MVQSYGGLICLLAWASGSLSHPPEKRAVALALINCVGQFGAVVGSYVSSCTFHFFLKRPFNCFFYSDISGRYLGVLHTIYLILSA